MSNIKVTIHTVGVLLVIGATTVSEAANAAVEFLRKEDCGSLRDVIDHTEDETKAKNEDMYFDFVPTMKSPSKLSMRFFAHNQFPPVDWETDEVGTISDPVLVDIDGKRSDFRTARYHFDNGFGWMLYAEYSIGQLNEKEFVWTFLPLAKYDKN